MRIRVVYSVLVIIYYVVVTFRNVKDLLLVFFLLVVFEFYLIYFDFSLNFRFDFCVF